MKVDLNDFAMVDFGKPILGKDALHEILDGILFVD